MFHFTLQEMNESFTADNESWKYVKTMWIVGKNNCVFREQYISKIMDIISKARTNRAVMGIVIWLWFSKIPAVIIATKKFYALFENICHSFNTLNWRYVPLKPRLWKHAVLVNVRHAAFLMFFTEPSAVMAGGHVHIRFMGGSTLQLPRLQCKFLQCFWSLTQVSKTLKIWVSR